MGQTLVAETPVEVSTPTPTPTIEAAASPSAEAPGVASPSATPVEHDSSRSDSGEQKEEFLSDGTYIWRWGAWRDPVTDKAYEPAKPVAPAYVSPAQATAASGCPATIVSTFGANAPAACAVSFCESGWDPNATGAAGERSYFQIHPVHGVHSTYDPVANTLYAFQLSQGGTNWGPWTCKP